MVRISKNYFDSIDDAIKMLTKGIVDVDFIKQTGDKGMRHMRCTLNPKYTPEGTEDTISSIIKNAYMDDAIYRPLPVWDFIAGGWRSFYLHSTIEVQPSLLFGDTTELVEDIIGDKVDIEDEAMTGLIESVADMLQFKIAKVVDESPEKIVDFTASKLKRMALGLVKKVIAGRKVL